MTEPTSRTFFSFSAKHALLCASALILVACGGSDSADSGSGMRESATAATEAVPVTSPWSPLIPLTIIPAAAANLPNGKVLLWSAGFRLNFPNNGQTYTSEFNPATQTATETLVTQTGHDMFCSGTSNLPDGSLLINGGDDSGKTSIYNSSLGGWSTGPVMNITRAYQGNAVLQDGSVLTLGGSWNGGVGEKNGELYTPSTGWKSLPGVPAYPALGVDPAGVYRSDNHMWLFPSPNGQVLHAGPGANMNWIDPRGTGAIIPAGTRGDDDYSQGGNAVMYDIGKILKVGGAPAYENATATTSAYLVDVNAGVSVRKLTPMSYARIFSSAVALPNGQVIVIGGQTVGKPFSDDNSALVPELWDPATETFTTLPPIAVGRNYHSVALLLPDGRVLSGGGGLCGDGCAGNHPNAQIYTPAYLLNSDGTPATRPIITSAPATATQGMQISVSASSAISAFTLMRLSSNTHTVNNDQRRIPLKFITNSDGSYGLSIPANPGVVVPGYYMLFALNAAGVPSVSKLIRVSAEGAPFLTNPGTRTNAVGTPVSIQLAASTASGSLNYSAAGLPSGLSLNTTTGLISGTPSASGNYVVNLSVNNGLATTATTMAWIVNSSVGAPSYVKLEALSEINNNAWTSMAEFNLLDPTGALMSRAGWQVGADSVELLGQNGAAANAIDGDPASIWHTEWSVAVPRPPHSFIVNMGGPHIVGGFKYLPRQDHPNGTIAQWRFSTSTDGVIWKSVGTGNFSDLGGDRATEKTVMINRGPSLGVVLNTTSTIATDVSLNLSASDPDGDPLTYSAVNLPAGLSLNADSGLISGVPTTLSVSAVTVQVSDGQNPPASLSFQWTIAAPRLVIPPVLAPPQIVGNSANYTVSSVGGTGVRYRWDFGDGTPITTFSSATSANHAFASVGLYTVTVSAIDLNNLTTLRTFTQAIYATPPGGPAPSQSSNVALQGNRVWLVNQDSDTVSVFDAATQTKRAEIAVGAAPRSLAVAPNGRVWITNKDDASISIIDSTSLTLVQTLALPRASMPFGIAFAPDGGAAYVALEATGTLLKLNPTTGATVGSIYVGPNPRQISIPTSSDRVFVSRFISPPLPGEGTAFVQTQTSGIKRGGEIVVVTSALAIERTIVLQHSDRTDSPTQGRGIPNYLAAPVISPDGKSAWVPSKQDNVLRGSLRDGQALDFQNTVRAVTSRIDLGTFTEDYPARVDHDNSGLAVAAAFHPTGAYLFIALESSRHVAIIDPVRKIEIYRFDAGRAPDGLAVSADGLKLFVNNFMDRTLGVFDLTRLVNYGELNISAMTSVSSVSNEKLTPNALAGKQLFYDAKDGRLARDGYLSCAACHADGGHDGRVWDMTGLGEGLRNTIALRGRAGAQGFKHWSGNFDEIQDFEGQIRILAQGTGLMSDALFNAGTRSQPLGDKKAGLSADLDALAAYVTSLNQFAPSPNRNADGSLTTQAMDGKALFNANCASCHSGAAFTDSGAANFHDIGTLKSSSGNRLGEPLMGIDTPTLRDVWATAPYLHDGSAPTVAAAINAHTALTLSASQVASVAAYVMQIGGEEPAPNAGISGVRFVKLEALSEINGNQWSTMAEFNLLDAVGAVMPRTGWSASADSVESSYENGAAANAIDSNSVTYWHTSYANGNAPLPHAYIVNLGAAKTITGFKYLPRQDHPNGTIAAWRFYTSGDGVAWTLAGQGNFSDLVGDRTTEKTVILSAPAVVAGPAVVRYVKLDALSEVNGGPWTSMAEFNLFDTNGAVMPRTGWVASADSFESGYEYGQPANALDGSASSYWHTAYSPAIAPIPHTFTVDLGIARAVGGFRYTPRPGGGNGTIANWRFSASVDGSIWVVWGQGNFNDLGSPAADKSVRLTPPSAQ